ncbi:MAG: hypothetical protein AB1758_23995, partial [Candidatus Eremiobacterota bacterium]
AVQARLVRVRVLSSGRPVELSTLIGEPVRTLHPTAPLRVVPVTAPNPVPRDQTAVFEAHAFDDNDQEIQDVTFRWYVAPGNGNGTLSQSPDGTQATFTNVVVLPLRPPAYTGGSCFLAVRMRYGGMDVTSQSSSLTLEGP